MMNEVDERLESDRTHAFIVLYSPSQPKSLDEAIFFLNSIRIVRGLLPLPCVLVANKMDLGGDTASGKAVAERFGVPFFEHSIFKERDWENAWLAALKMPFLANSAAQWEAHRPEKAKCVLM